MANLRQQKAVEGELAEKKAARVRSRGKLAIVPFDKTEKDNVKYENEGGEKRKEVKYSR